MIQLSGTTLSALRAFGLKFQVTANNIANVNTDGFKKSRADLKDNQKAGKLGNERIV
jgi:flagellar hook protein FlgE